MWTVMPELPEVETIRRDLSRHLPGARVANVWTSGKRLHMRRAVDVKGLRAATVGHRITELRRRGKYLFIDTDAPGTVMVHLGMTGRLVIARAADPRPAHTHVVFALDRGRELRFSDARRFGQVTTRLDHVEALGVDPIAEELTTDHLVELAHNCRRRAKAFLMDQSRIAGLGNIYVCEALYLARIHPEARVDRLARARLEELRVAILDVLQSALSHRGTTLRDYTDGEGRAGRNQFKLHVYDKEGQRCARCKGLIRRIVQEARSTFFCGGCQRRK
jgi:formamidopyrimidine-DNA glycosylase